MSNILTIFRKELNSYFNSPIAYLVMAFFGLDRRLLLLCVRRDLRVTQHGVADDGPRDADGRQ